MDVKSDTCSRACCVDRLQNQERKSLKLSARYDLFTFSTTHSEQSGTKFGEKNLNTVYMKNTTQ